MNIKRILQRKEFPGFAITAAAFIVLVIIVITLKITFTAQSPSVFEESTLSGEEEMAYREEIMNLVNESETFLYENTNTLSPIIGMLAAFHSDGETVVLLFDEGIEILTKTGDGMYQNGNGQVMFSTQGGQGVLTLNGEVLLTGSPQPSPIEMYMGSGEDTNNIAL